MGQEVRVSGSSCCISRRCPWAKSTLNPNCSLPSQYASHAWLPPPSSSVNSLHPFPLHAWASTQGSDLSPVPATYTPYLAVPKKKCILLNAFMFRVFIVERVWELGEQRGMCCNALGEVRTEDHKSGAVYHLPRCVWFLYYCLCDTLRISYGKGKHWERLIAPKCN